MLHSLEVKVVRIKQVLSALCSTLWQRAYSERVIGTIRRSAWITPQSSVCMWATHCGSGGAHFMIATSSAPPRTLLAHIELPQAQKSPLLRGKHIGKQAYYARISARDPFVDTIRELATGSRASTAKR
jgi:hypothetical protein